MAIDGLGQIIVHARRQTGVAIALHGIGGHGDDHHIALARRQAADNAGGGQSVHARHLHVHEDQIVVAALDQGDRLAAIVGHVGAMAQLGQQPHRHLLVDGVVLGHQNPQGQGRQRHRGMGQGGMDRLRRAAKPVHQAIEQDTLAHRLGQHVVQAQLVHQRVEIGGIGRGGQHQPEIGAGRIGAQHRGQIQTAHVRHVVVEQQKMIGSAAVQCLPHRHQGGGGVVEHVDGGAPVLQLVLEHFTVGVVVVHHQQTDTFQGIAHLGLAGLFVSTGQG